MDRSLTDYFFNPFLNIYYFFQEDDFNEDYVYFILNEIIGVAMNLFGCLYNEYIILYCCDLEKDTKDGITYRAINFEMKSLNLMNFRNEEISIDDNRIID